MKFANNFILLHKRENIAMIRNFVWRSEMRGSQQELKTDIAQDED